MGFFHHDSEQAQAYQQFQQYDGSQEHKSKFSHELIAGAAAFGAEKAYQAHCQNQGQPETHTEAKDILAGFVGAFVDREVETKGLDFVDREQAKHRGREQAYQVADNQFGQGNY